MHRGKQKHSSIINLYADAFLGDCYRHLQSTPQKRVYLTFDDGPSASCTEDVLKILKKYSAKATFFLIANKALEQPQLSLKIIAEGHSVGNHSLDHNTSMYFRRSKAIRSWILEAKTKLEELTGEETVGFRPPVGIRTPETKKALNALKEPTILWNKRFFDTVFQFTEEKATLAAKSIQHGDIVLLHDTHSGRSLKEFLKGLDIFLRELTAAGFSFECIKKGDL